MTNRHEPTIDNDPVDLRTLGTVSKHSAATTTMTTTTTIVGRVFVRS